MYCLLQTDKSMFSFQDILENELINLDKMFIASMIKDVIQVYIINSIGKYDHNFGMLNPTVTYNSMYVCIYLRVLFLVVIPHLL